MLLVFGDSFSMDEGSDKPQQWFKQLSKLLYNDDTNYKSYASGGSSNYSIVINQILRNFYKHYTEVEYIVINLTYLHRFRFYGNDYQPSMDGDISGVMYNRLKTDGHNVDKDLIDTFASSYVLVNDIIKDTQYGELIVTLNGFLRWATKQGIKVLVFDVDGMHENWWLDKEFYCSKKRLQKYLKDYNTRPDSIIYSNHMTLEDNLVFANAIYDEIKK